ncbi:TraR/DksA family transcriptional regulator [Desulfosarcina ovata]|uniref:RNA polymerase-binding transcription factor DksA n=2 Tax=Desulfosarcina ovata TaxID=83564 RepID=A0A5K8AEM2_9BACT|nr:TraR/DksA C4-type zinc finger protein [Desulfosarcina ovata]BBO84451.1 RNA polymerase-binding transcription factor DksA [Desulfosarcina ovata subsp. sediminis]BBO90966.1 RNA polymerase-binding transcription factor DksA [Desulfosarcina ovata subsp. ovata]
MDEKDLDYFRNLLQAELDTLLDKAGVAVGELLGTAYTSEADPLDRASEDLARNNQLRMRERESRLIAKIRKCLQAIEEGTYGICETCEEPISIARLKARPVTSYCIACKTRQEAMERVTGT